MFMSKNSSNTQEKNMHARSFLKADLAQEDKDEVHTEVKEEEEDKVVSLITEKIWNASSAISLDILSLNVQYGIRKPILLHKEKNEKKKKRCCSCHMWR